MLNKIVDFLGGGFVKTAVDTVKEYFPPDLSPAEKAELELKMTQVLNEQTAEANRMLTQAAVQLDSRIKEQEGTAKDLLAMPILGKLILFLRGLQRPLWGFATLYMDFLWLFGTYSFDEQQNTAMIVINILVLGFLFGERTIKNLEPLIIKVFGKGG